MRGVSGASGCTVYLGNARSTVQLGESLLGFCCGRVLLTSPSLKAVGRQVFPRKLGSRARICGHAAAPDPPGGVSVPSLLRVPNSIWGFGTPWEVRGPRLFLLSVPFSGTRGDTGPVPERDAGPRPLVW